MLIPSRVVGLVLGFLSAVVLVGCPGEDPVDDGPQMQLPDAGATGAPRFSGLATVTLEPGGRADVDLSSVLTDSDDELTTLRVTAVSSAHVVATLQGLVLTLRADPGFEGIESIALRAQDPSGLTGDADLRVEVGDVSVPEDVGPDGDAGDAGDDALDDGGDVRPDAPDMPDLGPDEPADPAPRSCATVFEYDPRHGGAQEVSVGGEFNGFDAEANPMQRGEDGIFRAELEIAAGDYGYKIVRNGDDWIFDPDNKYRKRVGCCDNSRIIVPECQGPEVRVLEAVAEPETASLRFAFEVFDSAADEGVDWESLQVDLRGAGAVQTRINGTTVEVVATGLHKPNRYTLRASVADMAGVRSAPIYVPVWLEDTAFEWRDATLYFAFTDRFVNGDVSNDGATPDVDARVNWAGGDWAGIRDRIEAGYFDTLGVNALWISAVVDNPDGRESGADGRSYTAYHGYFPSAQRDTENHFGTMEDLRDMVDAAHRHGIRVLVDAVGNQIHSSHPWRTERPADWFNEPGLCRDNDGWNVRPETCWFEPYLPDLRYEEPEVPRSVAIDAAWWVSEAHLDGFRVDAVKHMPHEFGYALRAYVDPLFAQSNASFYMVGETFVGTWSPETGDSLKAYIGPAEIDGQFDFPLYWELLRIVGRGEGGFGDLDRVIVASEGYYGPTAVMSTFLGNHDVPRFITHAQGAPPFDLWGNGGQALAWDDANRPGQPGDALAYDRAVQAFAFLMTMPGVPLIYYGDEIGMPGAGDPGNRRVFSDAGLNAHQQRLREAVGALGRFRGQSRAARRGLRRTVLVEDSTYAWVRSAGSEGVVTILSRAGGRISVALPAPFQDGDSLLAVVGPDGVVVSGGRIEVDLPPNGVAVLARP